MDIAQIQPCTPAEKQKALDWIRRHALTGCPLCRGDESKGSNPPATITVTHGTRPKRFMTLICDICRAAWFLDVNSI